MNINLHFINAFSKLEKSGNPACVVQLEKWLNDSKMLEIAKKNKVAETAFFLKKEKHYHLRWFTPEIEMDLCGHATLATAHYIFTKNKNLDEIHFKTKSGMLKVSFLNKLYNMVLPRREGKPSILPKTIKNSLNIQPKEVYKSRDYLLVYNSQSEIESISINREIFDQINLSPGGVIVTSVGENHDFVSRFFTPQSSILEDPVTGSAHCTLIPYWSKKLKKRKLKAAQLSKRGGKINCLDNGNSVTISGHALTCHTKTMIL
jgi:PhzF family phenazine biosynthesis protein